MRYANIIFDRKERLTIGDDMQLLAIENLYKYMGIDYSEVIRIPFHQLATYNGDYVVLPISFPLFGYHTDVKVTQFSDKIIPVFLGLSTLSQNYSAEDLNYLRRYEPIGCRDYHTMEGLRKNNILAYLNCCMTATFSKREQCGEYNKIYCVDVPESFKKYIPQEILSHCIFLSHTFYPNELPEGPEKKAKDIFELYRNTAKMMITTRLHAALPCVAAGIPVILFKDHLSYRFTGLDRLIHVYTREEYENIDWNPPIIEYEALKQRMLKSAADRVIDTYNKYSDIFAISSFYESRDNRPYYIEFYSNTVDYIIDNISREQEFHYALWGVTQTAESIYTFLKYNYPNAHLDAVIDKAKRLVFCGIETVTKEWLEGHNNTFCFVCTGAAIKESYEYFKQIGHKRYYQSCDDGQKHSQEVKYEPYMNDVI